MKKWLIILLLILSLNFFAQDKLFSAKPTISVAVMPDLAPLSYVENQQIKGFFVELIKYILKDYNIVFVQEYWAEAFRKVADGNIDIITTIIKTDEREQIFDFTEEYVITTWSQIISLSQITDPYVLRNKKIGYMRNDQNSRNFVSFMNSFNISYNLIEYDNYQQLEEAIISGEVFAGPTIGYYLPRYSSIKQSNIVFSINRLYYATTKGKNSEILQFINNEIIRLKSDPDSKYYELLKKYINKKEIIRILPEWLYIIFFIIFLIIIFILIKTLLLKKRADEKSTEAKILSDRFEYLFENMAQGVIYYSTELKILDLNTSMKQIFNIDKKEIIGLTFEQLVKYLDLNFVSEDGSVIEYSNCPIIQVKESKKELSMVVGIHSRFYDGYKWVIASTTPEFDSKNNVIRYYQTYSNITDLKIALDKIEEREKESKKIIENMSSAFSYHKMIYDKEGKPIDYEYIQTNEKFHQLTGFPRDCIGKTLSELNPEVLKDEIKWIKLYGEVAATQAPKKIEKYSDALGKWFDIATYSPKEGYFVSIFNDITDRKNSEQILKASEDALRENQKRLSTTFESIGDGVITVDTNLRITMMNKIAKNILNWETGYFGADLDQVLKIKNISIEGQSIKDLAIKVLENKKPYYINYAELNIEALGVTRIIEDSISPIYNNDTIYGLVIVFRDITEKILTTKKNKELQQQLNQSQKLESIGQFSGGIAHNFNNIITAINGYISLIESDVESKQKQFDYIEEIKEIKKAAERATKLTSQLLTVSRRQSSNPEILDVKLVVKDMINMIKSIAGENIEIITELKSQHKIKADQNQIEQMILNFIANSRDALNSCKIDRPKKITIEMDDFFVTKDYSEQYLEVKEGEYVILSFSDNGIGIPDNIKDKIFDPFFTTKESGKGSGLGLSTVYGIIKQNNAAIHVYSEVDKGTTIKVFWPVSYEEGTKQQDNKTISSKKIRGNEKILFVEDEPSLQDLAKKFLTELGYNIIIAIDGKDGLDKLNGDTANIDLVITDMVMPKMSGVELYQEIKKVNPNIKVLFTSGYTKNHLLGEINLDDTQFISKPYSFKALAQKIREILDN